MSTFVHIQPGVPVGNALLRALDAETEHALFEKYPGVGRDNPTGGVTILASHWFSTVACPI